MSRKSLLYYLFSKDKKPLYKDSSGHIQEGDPYTLLKPDGQPAHLKFSPDGWKDTLVKMVRNVKYMGLFRDMTVPMKFVGDGADILKDRFWKNGGIHGKCSLGIAKLDRTGLPHTYRSWYLSDINFGKYKETETGVQVEALEGGLSKLIKAYENTVYTLPVDDDPEHIKILMDGLNLYCTFDYRTFVDFEGTAYHLVPITYAFGEGTNINLSPSSTAIIGQSVSAGYQVSSDQWFMTCFGDVTPRFHGQIRLVPFTSTGTYTLTLRTSRNRTKVLYTGFISTPTVTINFDDTFLINDGENVFLEATWTGGTNITYGEAEIKVDFKNKYKATKINALYAYRVFEALIDKISSGKYSVSSSFLKSLKSCAITSGDAIRGLTGAEIKTSLNDFFKSMGFFSIGLGVENNAIAVIEQLSKFFGPIIVANFGEVASAELNVAEELVFNTIRTGGQKQDYQDVNGKYEVNQGQQWTTPITEIIRELDLTTPYRRDPYGIEFTRINLNGKTTTDSSSDNDTFMINIEETLTDDYYKLNRPAYTSITGILDPETIFNVEYSPKRGILNNGAMIHAVMDQQDISTIDFQSADKNAEQSTTLAGITIAEKESIQIGGLPDKLFLPYYVNFKTQVPINIMELLNVNPYGKISFDWNGLRWYGFIMDSGIRPATLDAQTITVLMAPENDMSKFNAR